MGREPILTIVIGRKRVGKSYITMQVLRKLAKGDPGNGTPPRKVLIFDTNKEYSNERDIKLLALKDVALFSRHSKVEMRRVQPVLPTGVDMTPDQQVVAVLHILNNYKNGVLLLEDINSYIGDYVPGDAVGVILKQRHVGVDVILHYHSFGRVQKKIWPHINMIRMHKCNDGVNSNYSKFPDKYEIFKIAENIVNDQDFKGNHRFYLYIDNDVDKIHANISVQERDEAIDKYISECYNQLVSPYLNMRNSAGEKTYTYASSVAEVKKRLISKYFL